MEARVFVLATALKSIASPKTGGEMALLDGFAVVPGPHQG